MFQYLNKKNVEFFFQKCLNLHKDAECAETNEK